RGTEKATRSGSVFVMNRHRGADRAGGCDVSFELYEIGMRHDPIRDIDGEAVAGIACASLRHEEKVPRAVKGRAPPGGRRHRNQAARCNYRKESGLHGKSPDQSRPFASLKPDCWPTPRLSERHSAAE